MNFWDDIVDFSRDVGPLMILLVSAFLLMMVPVYFLTKEACEQQTEHFESRFGLFTDCQVKVNGRWLQWDHYRATEETKNE